MRPGSQGKAGQPGPAQKTGTTYPARNQATAPATKPTGNQAS